ncbi:MAG: phosphate ABC transporter substrate-binding protein PstS, partial [Nitrosopumilus sp.]|nr:phosphate ABC transporter substrate-binding protein PstS [Nitrosopumilus sp.]
SATVLPNGSASWSNVSITNAPGPDSYPISSFSYILLYEDLGSNPSINQQKAKAVVDFISWAITDGQKFSSPLGYVPLSEAVVEQNQQTLNSLTLNGKPISTN